MMTAPIPILLAAAALVFLAGFFAGRQSGRRAALAHLHEQIRRAEDAGLIDRIRKAEGSL